MKCPKCSGEIGEHDLFCGFCGTPISGNAVKKGRRKGGRIRRVIVLFFVVLAVLSGTGLGFAVSRGVVRPQSFSEMKVFQWTEDWNMDTLLKLLKGNE